MGMVQKFFVSLGFMTATAALAGAATPPPKIIRMPVRGPVAVNPHLRGVKLITPRDAVVARHPPTVQHDDHTTAHDKTHGHDEHLKDHVTLDREHFLWAHRLWANRWDAVAWRTAHLRYGAMRGVVIDAAGRPLRNVRVWLRKPGGGTFAKHARAHAVMTDAAGRFAMTHVLAQAYRLCVRPNPHAALQQDKVEVRPSVTTAERFEFH
jgi:hypothetical protein